MYIQNARGAENRTEALRLLQQTASQSAYKYAEAFDDASDVSIYNFIKQSSQADISLQAQNKSLSATRSLISEYATGLTKCGLDQREFVEAVAKTNPQLANYLATTNQANVSMKGYIGTLARTKLGMIATQVAATAMNAAISMGVSLLIQLGVSLISKGWEWIKFQLKSTTEKIEIFNEQLKTAASEIKDTITSFRSLQTSANEVIPRFVELAKGVNDLGENVSLTDEEYEEFLSLNNKIAEMFPELNLGMDSNGNAMLALSYSADTLSESLWNLVEAQRAQANEDIAAKFGESTKSISKIVKEQEKNVQSYQSELKKLQDAYNMIQNMVPGSKRSYSWTRMGTSYNLDDALLKELGVNLEKTTSIANGGNSGKIDVQFNFDVEDVEKKYKEAESIIMRQIKNAQNESAAKWKELNPIASAWLQTDYLYNDLGDQAQNIVRSMVSQIDFSKLGLETEDEIKSYIKDYIVKPFFYAEPEVKGAIENITNWKSQLAKGEIDAEEFANKIRTTFSKLYNGVDEESRAKFVSSFVSGFNAMGIEGTNFNQVLDNMIKEWGKVKGTAIPQELDDVADAVDEITESVEELEEETTKMIEILDFSTLQSDLGKIESDVKGLFEAMDQLKEGTAYTTEELAKMALKYPELLKASNLFTEGSIDGQLEMLNTVLDSYEAEYDGHIDTKIAELRATNSILEQQIDLENKKKNKVIEIADLQSNGKLDSEATYAKLLKQLRDLEGQNFVSYSDGVLKVNEEALNDMLAQDKQKVLDSEEIWEQQGQLIVDAHTEALKESLNVYPRFLTKLKDWHNTSLQPFLNSVADNISNAFAGKKQFNPINTEPGSPYIGGVDTSDLNTNAIDIKTKWSEKSFTIDGKSVDEWAKQYEEVIADRISTITEQIGANGLLIENLESLKGLTLDRMYHEIKTATGEDEGTGTSSESDKETKEDAEKAVEETIESFDYIAIAISRAQRAAEQMKKAFSSTYQTLSTRANAFKNVVASINNEIATQNSAANSYLNAANAIGISEDIKRMVREGAIQLSEFDSDTAKLISKYQDLYEKYLSCIDAAADLRDEIAALYEQNFSNVQKDFDNQLSMITHHANTIQKQIENVQENGYILTRDYYDQLLEVEYERIQALHKERQQLQNALDLAVKSGEIKEYSESWLMLATLLGNK